jgi:tRNA A37 N6-isopentenylltransferase MiaA
LYSAIDARVDEMLERGFVEEVKRLIEVGPVSAKPFGAIGYRHVLQYLNGTKSYSQMLLELKRDTRRFAKRQMTWWRNQPQRLGWRYIEIDAYRRQSDLLREDPAVHSGSADLRCLEGVLEDFLEENQSFREEGIAFIRIRWTIHPRQRCKRHAPLAYLHKIL